MRLSIDPVTGRVVRQGGGGGGGGSRPAEGGNSNIPDVQDIIDKATGGRDVDAEKEAAKRRAELQKKIDAAKKKTRKDLDKRLAAKQKAEEAAARAQQSAAAAAARRAEQQAERERVYGAGMRGISQYEQAGRSAIEQALANLGEMYAPEYQRYEQEQASELARLEQALGLSRSQIDESTQSFLSNLRPSTAYQDVPIMNLEQEENPLLAALQSQGAGTGEVEAQRGLAAALSGQLAQMQQRSAQQYGGLQADYLDALRRSAQGAQTAGIQQLSQLGPQIGANIRSQYGDVLSQLRRQEAEQRGGLEGELAQLLAEIAKQRAETEQKYGPKKRPAAAAPAGRRPAGGPPPAFGPPPEML
jgi:hypothetical protein